MTGLTPHIADSLRRSGYRVVITGAGGWVGMATTHMLADVFGPHFSDRVKCFGSAARPLQLFDGRVVEQQSLSAISNLESKPTLVLHTAFLTKDRAEAMSEDDYRAANGRISNQVLDALDGIGVEGIFIASSGAARSADDPAASQALRLYGDMKRSDEVIFRNWAERHGQTAVITRIFNLSGPYINKVGSYALASFIVDALAGRPVKVGATHPVFRGYVAISELMSVIFAQLLHRAGVSEFDSGGVPVELGDLAELVARLCGNGGVIRPPMSTDPQHSYLGNDVQYQDRLRHYRVDSVALPEQIRETAKYLAMSRT